MTEPKGGVKTLAIRLPDELHAQLVLIASLDGMSLTDTIRTAIEALIAAKRAEGDLATRASQALAEIEREAAARRDAIQALFGPTTPPAEQATPAPGEPTSPPRRRGHPQP